MNEAKEEKNKEKESYEDFVSQFIVELERALGVKGIPSPFRDTCLSIPLSIPNDF